MNNFNKMSLLVVLINSLFACTSDISSSVVSQKNTKNTNIQSPIGKPSPAPITMDYKILNPLAKPGEEIQVEVKFKSRLITPIVSVVTSAEKLTWINSKKSWQSVMNKSGGRESLPTLKVVAPSDGIYYIRMIATIELDGKSMSKPFVIPVKVGNIAVELEPVGEIVTDEKGQVVIIQKANDES